MLSISIYFKVRQAKKSSTSRHSVVELCVCAIMTRGEFYGSFFLCSPFFLSLLRLFILKLLATNRVWTGGQWVQWETRPMHVQGNPLHLRKFPLHFLFCFSPSNDSNSWYQIQQFSKKCWIFWVFWFYFMFQDISSKKKKFPHQTDRKIPLQHDFWLSVRNSECFPKKFC